MIAPLLDEALEGKSLKGALVVLGDIEFARDLSRNVTAEICDLGDDSGRLPGVKILILEGDDCWQVLSELLLAEGLVNHAGDREQTSTDGECGTGALCPADWAEMTWNETEIIWCSLRASFRAGRMLF